MPEISQISNLEWAKRHDEKWHLAPSPELENWILSMFKDMELQGLELNIHHFSVNVGLEAIENCLIMIHSYNTWKTEFWPKTDHDAKGNW